MSFSVKMPALGESVTEGTVTRWLKAEGDQVALDEPLLEVSTDKVDTEIPSPAAGKLEKILIPVDSVVAVGTELALIGDGASSPSAPVAAAPVPTPAPAPTPASAPVVQAPIVQAPVVQAPVAPVVAVEKPVPAPPKTPPPLLPKPAAASVLDDSYVTPIVRKLASENGVDLSRVSGTGVGGRIRKEDVMAAVSRPTQVAASPAAQTFSAPSEVRAQSVAVSPLRGTTVSMSRLRKVIAARMLESLSVSAQLTTVIEVDITKIARLREKAKATFEGREGVKLTYLPFFAVAVCEALKQHPVVNASVEGDQITYHGAEHLGIAVDTERGLLVPVIRDAGDLNMGGIARRIVDVASRTRDNKISPDDLGGGTFTITNTGSRGALFDTPIINLGSWRCC
jgi:2-oxoglutarate dehydrogenase E2 component (dihydrolipoamide succinyltransferase)